MQFPSHETDVQKVADSAVGGHSEQAGSAGWVHRNTEDHQGRQGGPSHKGEDLQEQRGSWEAQPRPSQIRAKLRPQQRKKPGKRNTSSVHRYGMRYGGALPENWVLLVLYTVTRVTRLLPCQGCSATPHWAARLGYMSSFQGHALLSSTPLC